MSAVTGQATTTLHVALVHGPDMEPYVVVAASRSEVVRRLARYIAPRAQVLLWPDDARRVARRLAARDLEGAVAFYFEALGDPGRKVRWERQWVVHRAVRVPGNAEVIAA